MITRWPCKWRANKWVLDTDVRCGISLSNLERLEIDFLESKVPSVSFPTEKEFKCVSLTTHFYSNTVINLGFKNLNGIVHQKITLMLIQTRKSIENLRMLFQGVNSVKDSSKLIKISILSVFLNK